MAGLYCLCPWFCRLRDHLCYMRVYREEKMVIYQGQAVCPHCGYNEMLLKGKGADSYEAACSFCHKRFEILKIELDPVKVKNGIQ